VIQLRNLLEALPREGRLISQCISLAVAVPSGRRPIVSATANLNWSRVAEFAEGHFVVPAVFRTISQEFSDVVPDAVLKRLHNVHLRNAIVQKWLARELVWISADLTASGGRMIALKGPALTIQAYEQLADRQSGDLDILIRPRDLSRTAESLIARGYRPRRYCDRGTDLGFYRSFEDQFVSERGEVVDLHLNLVPTYFPLPMDPAAVWSKSVGVNLEGAEVATLAPDDQLLFAIVHASKHGWSWAALRSMCDIAALTATGSADWEDIEGRMTRAGCGRMLRLGAVLSHAFAGAQVPEPVLERATADRRTMDLAAGIARRLFPPPSLLPSIYSDWVVPAQTIEGAVRRVRYVLTRGLRPTVEDMEAFPLPKGMRWAYCLTRPFRLAILHGPRLLSQRRGLQG
jgi:hypothetical protein